jgi:hypothetical protein
MRYLILGYVEYYTADDLRPFVDSLRRTSFDGDVAFFVRGLSDATIDYLETQDIRCIRTQGLDTKNTYTLPSWLATGLGLAEPEFRPDMSVNPRLSALIKRLKLERTSLAHWMAKRLWHCHSARFFYYREHLAAHPEYDAVMITDVRDVLFQDDPFRSDLAEGLTLFEEYPGRPLHRQKNNAYWIESLYGTAALQQLQGVPILCMGVMMGTTSAMIDTLDVLLPDMLTRYIGWGTDQGVLNYLARTGALSDVHVHPYGSGAAMHMGIAPRDTLSVDGAGRVLNAEGEVCPVLHQYDRHPSLNLSLLRPTASAMVA